MLIMSHSAMPANASPTETTTCPASRQGLAGAKGFGSRRMGSGTSNDPSDAQ